MSPDEAATEIKWLREELTDVREDAALLRAEIERLTKERDEWKEKANECAAESPAQWRR